MLFGQSSRGVSSFGDLAWKRPVNGVENQAGTLAANTLSPATGVSVGQTLTANANGALTNADFSHTGAFAVGMRVLVTSQASPKNGIYTITAVGTAGTPWVLTRAIDADTTIELPVGTLVADYTNGGLWGSPAGVGAAFYATPNILLASAVGFRPSLGAASDARIVRTGAKIVTLDDAAAGALIALDGLGANLRGFSGTSFPATKATNDRFFRTDLLLWFVYDGTRWLSETLFHFVGGNYTNSATYALNLSTTAAAVQRCNTVMGLGTDVWLIDLITTNIVQTGGSALSGSHKWVSTLNKVDAANAASVLGTTTIDSGGSAPTWHTLITALDVLLGTSATYPTLRLDWAKTGTPGDLSVNPGFVVTYRIVQT